MTPAEILNELITDKKAMEESILNTMRDFIGKYPEVKLSVSVQYEEWAMNHHAPKREFLSAVNVHVLT